VVPAHPATFAALAVPNFRRYVSGQSLSLIGTWVETVAQAPLVLRLTQAGFGLVSATLGAPVHTARANGRNGRRHRDCLGGAEALCHRGS
jgi:hypothetical protein